MPSTAAGQYPFVVLPNTIIGRVPPAIGRVPVFHRLQDVQNLRVVVAIGDGEHVPSVRRPLILQPVAIELAVHHAADQGIVDTGIVVGEEDAEPLAGLKGDGLRLQFLRVAGAHREFAFERDDLRRSHRRADDVPERGFPGSGRDAYTGRSAVDVVGDVGGLDVSGERADASSLGFGKPLVVGESVIGQQILERARAAPEPQRID